MLTAAISESYDAKIVESDLHRAYVGGPGTVEVRQYTFSLKLAHSEEQVLADLGSAFATHGSCAATPGPPEHPALIQSSFKDCRPKE